jgi:hypothetical protein
MQIDLGVLLNVLAPVISIGGAIVAVMRVYNAMDKRLALAEVDRREMRKDIDAIANKGRTSTEGLQELRLQMAEIQATLSYIKDKIDRVESYEARKV